MSGAAIGTTFAFAVPHHSANATGSAGFHTVATTAAAGVATDTTGKPDWLPAGATLVRHDIDEYGVRVWIYALPSANTLNVDPPMLRISAVASASLDAPTAPPGDQYAAGPQDVDGAPGQVLHRNDGGMSRVDFLRDGIAYTVIATGGGTGSAPALDTATVVHVAQDLER
ncbi:MAG TPA: hypothetical protein VHE83_15810 [Mycobacteriales bacterium]|nr:hypothetical protein [Mycobacteriales bacterium]